MWEIKKCEIRDAILDCGTDGISPIRTHAVYADNVCLMNAVTCCDFTKDPCQLLVCDCGYSGCQSGGYVTFRRVGDYTVIIPCFSLLASEDEFERTQYEPPPYLTTMAHCGAVFDPTAYSSLRTRIPEMPEVSRLSQLAVSEMIRIVQMRAPLQVLGKFPQPASIDRRMILAVTDGDTETEVQAVARFLAATRDSNAALAIAPRSESWAPIEFHLDGPSFPEWKDFVKFKGQIGFEVQPFGVLIIEA